MSDRIVRDEILDSERYASLSSDTARMLFIHFLLAADDLGNAEAGTSYVRKRLLLGASVNEAAVLKLLSELADADLVRLYTSDDKRYAHIPRYRQRLRYLNGKHPRPTSEIECAEISDLIRKKSDQSPSTVSPRSVHGQTVDGRSEVKRREVKHIPPPSEGFERFWNSWPSSPRKGAKGKCAELWVKSRCENNTVTIVSHVEFMKRTADWQKEGGAYVQAPLVYLGQRRWEGADTEQRQTGEVI